MERTKILLIIGWAVESILLIIFGINSSDNAKLVVSIFDQFNYLLFMLIMFHLKVVTIHIDNRNRVPE